MEPIRLDAETVAALCKLLKVEPSRVSKIVISATPYSGPVAVVTKPERTLS